MSLVFSTPKNYIEMAVEAMLYYGRELNGKEKDHLWIVKKTGSYGWVDTVRFRDEHLQGNPPRRRTRVAKLGNPIDYQSIEEGDIADYIGIFEDQPGQFVAQFLGFRRFRVPLTESEVELVLLKMAACLSMLSAVEDVLVVPLQEIQRKVLYERFRSGSHPVYRRL